MVYLFIYSKGCFLLASPLDRVLSLWNYYTSFLLFCNVPLTPRQQHVLTVDLNWGVATKQVPSKYTYYDRLKKKASTGWNTKEDMTQTQTFGWIQLSRFGHWLVIFFWIDYIWKCILKGWRKKTGLPDYYFSNAYTVCLKKTIYTF